MNSTLEAINTLYLNTPIGYKAITNPVNSYGCEFCSFSSIDSISCNIDSMTSDGKHGACSAQFRKDNTNVYFIKEVE